MMNTDKCKECNSTSLERCLKIQCPHFMNIKRDESENKDDKAESEEQE